MPLQLHDVQNSFWQHVNLFHLEKIAYVKAAKPLSSVSHVPTASLGLPIPVPIKVVSCMCNCHLACTLVSANFTPSSIGGVEIGVDFPFILAA